MGEKVDSLGANDSILIVNIFPKGLHYINESHFLSFKLCSLISSFNASGGGGGEEGRIVFT